MALNGTLMECLLTWVNSLKVADPIERLSQMQDLNVLIRIAMKLNGNVEETPQILKRSLEERLTFLQRHCRCGSKAENLVQWEKMLQGESSELEICKVIVLLFYVANMKCRNAQDWEAFDHKTQTELASILRFILDNEDDLTLDDKLIRFLQRKARIVSSSDSASSSDETLSPHLPVRQTQVRFLELHRVASSSTMKSLALDSPSSPMSEVLHMPQFQIRRLRKQLAEGRELRDELELELSETRKRLAEKDAQIFLMQQRIERLVVLNEKQADQQEPREMEELREKNESLMIRLRDALKQCQDMKTERSQLERKNDQLSEENGDLSYKVRDLSSRLAQLQEGFNEITEEHETSVSSWQQQHSRLESELSAAVTEKKCLEEHNQILEGKISLLEDQLKLAGERGAQEKGESMGDVLKMEHLQQEVVALNSKSAALQAQIARLEEEKSASAASFESQGSRFEYEKLQLQDIVTNLQTSLSEITFQKERQEQEARQQEEKLTCQITTLKLEISKLKLSLAQKDKELAGLSQEVEEERRQRGQLAEALQRHEESSNKTIEELRGEVQRVRGALDRALGDLVVVTEKLTSGVKIMKDMQEDCDRLIGEKDSALASFDDYRKAKEEQLDGLGQTLQTARAQLEADLVALEELRREKAELTMKVQELDATILDLIAKCHNLDLENDTQSKSHAATLEALRTQLAEKDSQLKALKERVSSMAQVGEENGQMKEQVASLEEAVKNLTEQLEKEKRYSATLESEKKRNAALQGDLEKLNERSGQARAELDKERAINMELESQLRQLKEELQARTEDLQKRVSSASDMVKLQEEEIEKLTQDVARWKDSAQSLSQVHEHLENLKRDHSEVCQRLEEERMKVSELEAQAKTATSAQLNRVSELESALSAARSQLEEKEVHEEKLLQTIHATEEKLKLAQQEKAERVSQLEANCSNTVEDLKRLSKELSEEKVKKEELQDALKKLQKQNSEKMSALESEMSAMQTTIKQRDGEADKLATEVERFRKLLEEVNQKHQQELQQKEAEVSRLVEEKEKAVSALKTEQATKTEVKARLEKSLDSHKNEYSALQNELSRSMEIITIREEEVQRLTKEMSAKEVALHREKETASKLLAEVETLKALKERASAQEAEIKRCAHTAKAAEVEMTNLRAAVSEKEREVQRLESDLKCKMEDSSSIHERYQATMGDVSTLKSKIAELERKCREEEDSLNRARKEAADAKTAASKMASVSEEQQRRIQELTTEMQQGLQKTSELAKQLEDSRSLQVERDSSLEALKKELFHKVQELEQSQKSLSESSKELSKIVTASQEQENALAEARQQIAQYQRDIEKTTGQADSIQEEMKNMASKLAINEQSYSEVKKLLEKETERSLGLENQLKAVQDKLESSAKDLIEKQGTVQSLSTEASSYREEAKQHKQSVEGLQKRLSSQGESMASLEHSVRVWQEKCTQKEEQLSGVQKQLCDAQSLLLELDSLRSSYTVLTADQTRRETEHKEELLRNRKTAETLQTELEKTKAEVASLMALKQSLCQKDAALETLQLENKEHVQKISLLQEDNQKLVTENKTLSQASSKEAEKLQTELAKISEKHKEEMESVRLQHEKMVSEGKEQVQDLSQKLEAVTSKYDHAKSRVLDERQKFQEEKQKLLAQVEQLEGAKKVQSEQVQELNKKLSQQEKTIQSHQEKLKRRDSEAHDEVEKKQKRLAELEAQLEQQNQAVEHYKAQMEKAKLHYDAKKEQNQELSTELQSLKREQEQQRKENAEIKMESERLSKELQLSLLQTKEAEQSCKTLTNQVRSLEAQVEFADRQLRELGKFQVATDAMKSRETICPPRATRGQADVSIDSLDMSDEDDHPMNSTRKNGRSHQEPSTSGQSVSPDAPAAGRLPRKVESLESLYFTPIPNRAQSKMDTSLGSIGDLSLDSSKKTRSGRRRTTQVINITMTKKTKEEVDPDSANTSFYSLRSALSHQSLHPQSARRGRRPQPASSAPALTSLPSQESLTKSERTSSDDSLNNSVLMNLPGYRPNTRSSARLSQTGGRSSFYVSTCQDEPDPQEDWSRIAELQLRNRACPPHLKTSYPLESRPSILSSTITDEEVKTGDPKETLRRATLLPNQIRESLSTGTRRKTLAPASMEWGDAGVTTRQQVKRVTEESHYGPDTPESKKSASCFPRPMTPKERPETRKMSAAESKASLSQQSSAGRRQSMAFTILSTPKKIGNSLLKRGLNKKTTPKTVSQGRKQSASSSPHLSVRKSPSRKSPRGSNAKSPKTSKFFERKQSRNK